MWKVYMEIHGLNGGGVCALMHVLVYKIMHTNINDRATHALKKQSSINAKLFMYACNKNAIRHVHITPNIQGVAALNKNTLVVVLVWVFKYNAVVFSLRIVTNMETMFYVLHVLLC